MFIRRFKQSFVDAFHGLVYVFKKEQSFRIQVAFAGVVLLIILYLPLKIWEVVVLFLLTVMVLTMELLNTALEHFTDMFKPRVHPYVGIIKDIMAGAVLITAIGALVIGLIIVFPHFIGFIK